MSKTRGSHHHHSTHDRRPVFLVFSGCLKLTGWLVAMLWAGVHKNNTRGPTRCNICNKRREKNKHKEYMFRTSQIALLKQWQSNLLQLINGYMETRLYFWSIFASSEMFFVYFINLQIFSVSCSCQRPRSGAVLYGTLVSRRFDRCHIWSFLPYKDWHVWRRRRNGKYDRVRESSFFLGQ